jgi:hypothetical protein
LQAPLLENDLTAPKQKPPEKKKETKPAPKKQDFDLALMPWG